MGDLLAVKEQVKQHLPSGGVPGISLPNSPSRYNQYSTILLSLRLPRVASSLAKAEANIQNPYQRMPFLLAQLLRLSRRLPVSTVDQCSLVNRVQVRRLVSAPGV